MLHIKYCTSTCLLHVHVECELLSGVYQETCNKSVDKVEQEQGIQSYSTCKQRKRQQTYISSLQRPPQKTHQSHQRPYLSFMCNTVRNIRSTSSAFLLLLYLLLIVRCAFGTCLSTAILAKIRPNVIHEYNLGFRPSLSMYWLM